MSSLTPEVAWPSSEQASGRSGLPRTATPASRGCLRFRHPAAAPEGHVALRGPALGLPPPPAVSGPRTSRGCGQRSHRLLSPPLCRKSSGAVSSGGHPALPLPCMVSVTLGAFFCLRGPDSVPLPASEDSPSIPSGSAANVRCVYFTSCVMLRFFFLHEVPLPQEVQVPCCLNLNQSNIEALLKYQGRSLETFYFK